MALIGYERTLGNPTLANVAENMQKCGVPNWIRGSPDHEVSLSSTPRFCRLSVFLTRKLAEPSDVA
jgi:hypothetical protein